VEAERLRVHTEEPLRRGRIAVALRLVLVLPPLIVLAGWSVLAAVVLLAAWVSAVATGGLPGRLHRFLAAYLRYSGQVSAWFHLLSGRYPAVARARTHPFAVEVPEPVRQGRLLALARPVAALPPVLLASVLRVVLTLSAVAAWLAALALGRTTAGLQELGTFCQRYELEAVAYLLLLTPRFPRLAPE
jgi:hypothetical protein